MKNSSKSVLRLWHAINNHENNASSFLAAAILSWIADSFEVFGS
jgi:hypothetical protein